MADEEEDVYADGEAAKKEFPKWAKIVAGVVGVIGGVAIILAVVFVVVLAAKAGGKRSSSSMDRLPWEQPGSRGGHTKPDAPGKHGDYHRVSRPPGRPDAPGRRPPPGQLPGGSRPPGQLP
ncbi:hypothetical protein FBEOM_60 [Fusarium beomiforme]|uniref:Uncharacterized protein n=1 Tax=Fusarium beomiforme TaxID=44412 RepID=A0A9P5AVT0_9HYPO|nr:hypothetical protein FBEOM_60 [Fusarium beomiforme]